jgi:hypothetical protein
MRRPVVSLYFTGTSAPDGPRPDFNSYEDPHIRLREILLLDDRRYVYRQQNPEADWDATEFKSVAELVEGSF